MSVEAPSTYPTFQAPGGEATGGAPDFSVLEKTAAESVSAEQQPSPTETTQPEATSESADAAAAQQAAAPVAPRRRRQAERAQGSPNANKGSIGQEADDLLARLQGNEPAKRAGQKKTVDPAAGSKSSAKPSSTPAKTVPKPKDGVSHKYDKLAELDLVHLDARGRAHYTSGVNIKNDADGNNLRDGKSLKGKFMSRHELEVLMDPEIQAQILDGLANRDEPGQGGPQTTPNHVPQVPPIPPQPNQQYGPWVRGSLDNLNGWQLPAPGWGENMGYAVPVNAILPPLNLNRGGIRGRIQRAMGNAWNSVQRLAGVVESAPDQYGGVYKTATNGLSLMLLRADVAMRDRIQRWQNLPEQSQRRRLAAAAVGGALLVAGAVKLYLESRGHTVHSGSAPYYGDTHPSNYIASGGHGAAPQGVELSLKPGVNDSMWRETVQYAHNHGVNLSEPDKNKIIPEIVRDNHQTMEGARHKLPGFRFTISPQRLHEIMRARKAK